MRGLTMGQRRRYGALAVALALALGVAACGEEKEEPAANSGGSEDTANSAPAGDRGTVTIDGMSLDTKPLSFPLQFDPQPFHLDEAAAEASMFGKLAASGWHHIGTTRMSDDPHRGVVDRHLRVHGVDDLWVAGSSVFPTSGYVNPTLTIVALALRLADRLRTQLRRA